jgi:serine phosphatase RsbU (regulator of sigma subunit)
VGVISFGACLPAGRFGEPELDFIDKLAPALSLALENARLFAIHQRVAETFQRSLLRPFVPVEGFEVGLAYVPAFEPEKVGGDFYDLFTLEGGLTAVAVGDVVGKGVEAAVLTQTVRTMLRTVASMERSPSLILKKVNDLLLESTGRQFVTVAVAVIDNVVGKVTISSAGHPPAIIYGKESRILEIPPAAPLGAGNGRFHEATFDIGPGDTLVLYTDGLIEARQGNELFGEKRALDELTRTKKKDVQEAIDTLVSKATEFAGGQLADDLVIIAVRAKKVGPERTSSAR